MALPGRSRGPVTCLLDTNVVSEPRKRRVDPAVAAWASRLSKRDAFLSVVVIREIEAGVLLVERRDPRRARC